MSACEHNSKAKKTGLCSKCNELKPYTTFKYCKTQCLACKECGWFYGSGASDNLAGKPVVFGYTKSLPIKPIPVASPSSISTWEHEGGSSTPYVKPVLCIECPFGKNKKKPNFALPNRLWCEEHAPEVSIAADKKRYAAYVKPPSLGRVRVKKTGVEHGIIAITIKGAITGTSRTAHNPFRAYQLDNCSFYWEHEVEHANPITPDPIIFIENFGCWTGEWQLGRKGRVAIEAVQRQYKLVAGHR